MQPSRTITKTLATSSLEKVLAILEREGSVILIDFMRQEDLDMIDEKLTP